MALPFGINTCNLLEQPYWGSGLKVIAALPWQAEAQLQCVLEPCNVCWHVHVHIESGATMCLLEQGLMRTPCLDVIC